MHSLIKSAVGDRKCCFKVTQILLPRLTPSSSPFLCNNHFPLLIKSASFVPAIHMAQNPCLELHIPSLLNKSPTSPHSHSYPNSFF